MGATFIFRRITAQFLNNLRSSTLSFGGGWSSPVRWFAFPPSWRFRQSFFPTTKCHAAWSVPYFLMILCPTPNLMTSPHFGCQNYYPPFSLVAVFSAGTVCISTFSVGDCCSFVFHAKELIVTSPVLVAKRGEPSILPLFLKILAIADCTIQVARSTKRQRLVRIVMEICPQSQDQTLVRSPPQQSLHC